MKTKELISEAISLPVEDRALVVESILRTLNPPDAAIQRKWMTVAKQRLDELRSGKASAVPGEAVFERVWRRFSS